MTSAAPPGVLPILGFGGTRSRFPRVKREILINGSQRETRVAILEDDRLVELLVDRADHRRTVGDIYKGRVEAVLPGIQAAFVDIGLEKSAFLHASDLLEPDEDEEDSDENGDAFDTPIRGSQSSNRRRLSRPRVTAGTAGMAVAQEWRERPPSPRASWSPGRRSQQWLRLRAAPARSAPSPSLPNIQDVLKKGQTLLVQVTKEPISTKGCRVTAQISLPGRFLVYMPYASKVGVSRKIESRELRAPPAGDGERSSAQGFRRHDRPHRRRGGDGGAFQARGRLAPARCGRRSTGRRPSSAPPRCVQRETSLTRGIIRDLFSAKVDALHVDSKELYNEVEQYLKQIDPELMSRVHDVQRAQPRSSTSSTSRTKSGTCSRPAAISRPAATSSSSPPKRWSRSTSTPVATPARRIPRRPSSRPTSRRHARSRGRSVSGTSAGSSSATSSTWRAGRTGTGCSRS